MLKLSPFDKKYFWDNEGLFDMTLFFLLSNKDDLFTCILLLSLIFSGNTTFAIFILGIFIIE